MIDVDGHRREQIPRTFWRFKLATELSTGSAFRSCATPYTLATKGQVRFHARKRVGADVTHPDRFVKLKVSV